MMLIQDGLQHSELKFPTSTIQMMVAFSLKKKNSSMHSITLHLDILEMAGTTPTMRFLMTLLEPFKPLHSLPLKLRKFMLLLISMIIECIQQGANLALLLA
jgi:hypothetical protein